MPEMKPMTPGLVSPQRMPLGSAFLAVAEGVFPVLFTATSVHVHPLPIDFAEIMIPRK